MITTDPDTRKATPIATGCLDYFPDALAEVARVSLAGNAQHNLGPLQWDKSKSTDEADALLRHLVDRGKLDSDGERHSAKVAWRALALLQRELDQEKRILDMATALTAEPGAITEYVPERKRKKIPSATRTDLSRCCHGI